MRYCVDRLTSDFIEGWAFSPAGIDRIEIYADGTYLGDAVTGLERADVTASIPEAKMPGFMFFFGKSVLISRARVKIRLIPNDGAAIDTPEELVAALHDISLQCTPRAPLHDEVVSTLRALRGQDLYPSEPWSDSLIGEAIEDIRFLVYRGSKEVPGIYPYLLYLKTLWVRYEQVRKHFPRAANPIPGQKDSLGAASSIEEMITIAHHLYVLRARLPQRAFCEFGCFKGYSTALLSQACFELGLRMHAFDSFAGLPASDSTYYRAGDFKGSLNEVRTNVENFGRIDVVEFHKGYFCDTLPECVVQPLCIWMDVDLESSSRDVSALLPTLPPESCVFSHECTPENFVNGQISFTRGTHDVIAPIADAFAAVARPITGRFLFGNTGAFWDADNGHQVLPTWAVLKLVEL